MTARHQRCDTTLAYREHVSEAVAALSQYLGCVRDVKEVGWGDECLRDLQHRARQAMIAATSCPVCANRLRNGNRE